MKAIVTTYHGPTNHRPARLHARDLDNNRAAVGYDHGFAGSQGQQHGEAARALCEKMGWTGTLHGGAIRGGYVWVFEGDWRTGMRIEIACAACEGTGRVPASTLADGTEVIERCRCR
jgi:hypothetical protein